MSEAVTGRSLPYVSAGIAVVAAALALRLWDLGGIGFNSDEAVYAGQAAALSGDAALTRFFSVFRAHPLLVQSLIALVFKVVGVTDVGARAFVAIVFGIGGIAVAAGLSRRMYGSTVALLAGAVLAVVPYHVLLSRQVTLDIPMTMLVTATLWCLYEFAQKGDQRFLLASGALFGLAVLTKETAVLLLIVIVLFLWWSGATFSITMKDAGKWFALAAIAVAPFVLTRILFGGSTTGGYLLYQVARPPNHAWWYFPVLLWEFVTPFVLVPAAIGVGVMLFRRTVADKLILAWLLVFGLFFQAWPTKLFFYLVPLIPPLAFAVGVAIEWIADLGRRSVGRTVATSVGTLVAAVALVFATVSSVEAVTSGVEEWQGPFRTDVEVQDFAGAREVSRWIGSNTPEGSVFLTMGPSLGNIVSFYGHREWYALSISKDPALRNPAYRYLPNPDLAIRRFEVHYALWDAYSADRSSFYDARLMRYVRKYSGMLRFASYIGSDGELHTGKSIPADAEPRVIVYDLVGGDPIEPQRLKGPS